MVLTSIRVVGTENLPITDTLGCILAERVIADSDLPSFSTSSMDGFAVRSSDIFAVKPDQPIQLDVVEDIPAGKVIDKVIYPGQSARIMTGVPLPIGADAVVLPVEDTNYNDRDPGKAVPKYVLIYQPVGVGSSIRPAGQDVRQGEVLLYPGDAIRPQDIGMLTMLGITHISVYSKPRIGVLSTGNELVPLGTSLTAGKIYDTSGSTLAALITKFGGSPISLDISPHDLGEVRRHLERGVDEKVDMIVSSAGVSIGVFDYVRSVVEDNGYLIFWKVNMRPGKPLAFGFYRNTPFFGLPGNPVSGYVDFKVYTRPALLKMAGATNIHRTYHKVTLTESIESDGRERFLRAVVHYKDGQFYARLTGHQDSGNLCSLVRANALLIVPSEVKSLPIGAKLNAWMLSNTDKINE